MSQMRFSLCVIAVWFPSTIFAGNVPVKGEKEKLPPGAMFRLGTNHFRHPGARSVAYSPDGKILATGASDIRLWDVENKSLLRVLPLPDRWIDGDVQLMKFTRDGKIVYMQGSGAGQVSAFDVATGKRLFRFLPEGMNLSGFDISPDEKILATGSQEGQLILWNAATREKLRTLPVHNLPQPGKQKGPTRKSIFFNSVAFSPDGKWLAASAHFDQLRIYEVATGKLKYVLPYPGLYGLQIIFSPDGYLATYRVGEPLNPNEKSAIILWDPETGKIHQQFDWEPAWGPGYHALAFSPDGKWMAGDGGKSRLCVWERATGKKHFIDPEKHYPFYSVAFSKDGNTLAAANGALQMWDLKTGQNLLTDEGHTGLITALDLSPDGSTVASTDGTTICFWNAKTGKEIRRLDTLGVSCLAFSPDGRFLVSGCWLQNVQLWDVATGKEIRCLAENVTARCVGFSPDGQTVAVSTGINLTVHFFETATGKEIRQVSWNEGGDFSTSHHPFRFSPDGKHFASLARKNGDVVLALWDMSQKEPAVFTPTGSHFITMAFSPDGEYLAWSELKQVSLWDIQARKKKSWKTKNALSLTFSPDGRYLVAGKDLLPLSPKLQSQALPVDPSHLAFSSDGRILAAVPKGDCTVLILDWKKLVK